jgi:hypothetical protein
MPFHLELLTHYYTPHVKTHNILDPYAHQRKILYYQYFDIPFEYQRL